MIAVVVRLSPTVRRIDGRAAVFAAAGDDAYTRMTLPAEAVGYTSDDAVAWPTALFWPGPVMCFRGTPAGAVQLLHDLRRAGVVRAGTQIRLPLAARESARGLPARHQVDWLFLSTTEVPAQVGQDDAVRPLSRAADDITALLRAGNPGRPADPDAPGIRRWFGIHHGDRLIACGADRSWNDVGLLARITVDPSYRGRGLGAALTTAITRTLREDFDHVALGVTTDNATAIRLYERLGYRTITAISSYVLLD